MYSAASIKETMTTSFAHGVRLGDHVRVHSDTNRVRRRVADAGSTTHFETVTYIRPSKGFRRHMRRLKAAKRAERSEPSK
jgi:hypothetical protein